MIYFTFYNLQDEIFSCLFTHLWRFSVENKMTNDISNIKAIEKEALFLLLFCLIDYEVWKKRDDIQSFEPFWRRLQFFPFFQFVYHVHSCFKFWFKDYWKIWQQPGTNPWDRLAWKEGACALKSLLYRAPSEDINGNQQRGNKSNDIFCFYRA